jgi:tRNA1Val (adenine37-N6)-methyltransferase
MIRANLISAYSGLDYLIVSDMSNDWFQFQGFLIRQDRSAMKVGTDGVLLGAWAGCSNCSSILDVGTGTGLIALMIAQRNRMAAITAIEIDPTACSQALENVSASPWADRITVVNGDFLSWDHVGIHSFDLIVCNPPFFSGSLKNPDPLRAAARHDDGLPLGALAGRASELLSPAGKLALILPAGRAEEAIRMAASAGLHVLRRTDVRGNPQAPVRRVLLEWGRKSGTVEWNELVIESGARGIYTDDYLLLTRDFYLKGRSGQGPA